MSLYFLADVQVLSSGPETHKISKVHSIAHSFHSTNSSQLHHPVILWTHLHQSGKIGGGWMSSMEKEAMLEREMSDLKG